MQNITALHGQLIDQALGQGGPALVRAIVRRNDFDPAVGFGRFSLSLAVEHGLENRRAIAREDQDHARFGLEFRCDDWRAGTDFLAFAFDGLDSRFGCRHGFLGAILVFEDRRMLVVGGIEFVEPRQFRLGERRRFGRKPDQPFDQIVAGIGIERRLDPGKTLLGGESFGLLFHLRGGKAFEQRNIDPGFAVVVIEEFALDPTPGSDVGVAANEPGARIAAPYGPGQDHSPNAVGIGRIVGR